MRFSRASRALYLASFAAASLSYAGLSWAGDPPASSDKATPAKAGKSDKIEKPEVEFVNQSELLQKLDRAIDRGPADAMAKLPQLPSELSVFEIEEI